MFACSTQFLAYSSGQTSSRHHLRLQSTALPAVAKPKLASLCLPRTILKDALSLCKNGLLSYPVEDPFGTEKPPEHVRSKPTLSPAEVRYWAENI